MEIIENDEDEYDKKIGLKSHRDDEESEFDTFRGRSVAIARATTGAGPAATSRVPTEPGFFVSV